MEGGGLAGLGEEGGEGVCGLDGAGARGEGLILGLAEVSIAATVELLFALGGLAGSGGLPHEPLGVLLLEGLTAIGGGGQAVAAGNLLVFQGAQFGGGLLQPREGRRKVGLALGLVGAQSLEADEELAAQRSVIGLEVALKGGEGGELLLGGGLVVLRLVEG